MRALVLYASIIAVLGLSAGLGYAEDTPDARGGGEFRVVTSANLREEPSTRAAVLTTLKRNTIVQVVGVSNGWYRIRSSRPGRPDGYIRRDLLEPGKAGSAQPAPSFKPGQFEVTKLTTVRREPSSSAAKVVDLRTGAKVYVTDRTGAWYRIESEKGDRPPGYILATAARPLASTE